MAKKSSAKKPPSRGTRPHGPKPTRWSYLGAPVQPQEVDDIRRRAHDIVRSQMPTVKRVLMGEIKWSPSQVNTFRILLNKVVPDLHSTHMQVDVNDRSLDELTVEELQEIVRRDEASQERDDTSPKLIDIDEAGNPINSEEPNAKADQPDRLQKHDP